MSGPYHFLQHWKSILVFFLFSAAASIYTSLDMVMLGTVLLPIASYYVETKQTQQYLHVLEKAFQFVIASALPLTLFFMLGAAVDLGLNLVLIPGYGAVGAAIGTTAAAAGMLAVQAVSGTHESFWNLLLTAGTFFGIYGILLLVMRETLILSILQLTK